MGLSKLEQLRNLMTQKKSKRYYAKRLGISENEVQELLDGIKKKQTPEVQSVEEGEVTFEQNLEKNEIKVCKLWTFAPKPEDVIKEHNIDENRWKLAQIWIKQTSKGYLTSAAFTSKQASDFTQEDALKIIKSVQPVPKKIKPQQNKFLPKAALILPKQDAHLDKFDIDGNNDIEKRFTDIENSIFKILAKAKLSNHIEKVTYIVGSDQFNSEWTQATTKGTPQKNILTYEEGFSRIVEHEAGILDLLLESVDKVDVIFVPGNHDHHVGWHLIHCLQGMFRKNDRISFDIAPKNRKYEKYSKTAIMFNHGDVLKGKDLAHRFPMEFIENWSQCENFYIFTGDKHHEVSQDIHGIKFFQVPALSTAKSFWDDKNGYTCTKAEMTGFLITAENGMTDIYKEML